MKAICDPENSYLMASIKRQTRFKRQLKDQKMKQICFSNHALQIISDLWNAFSALYCINQMKQNKNKELIACSNDKYSVKLVNVYIHVYMYIYAYTFL